MTTLFSGKLNALLAMALAALLALGTVSAFAGPAPDGAGDVVTVDAGDGDTEGDTEGGDSGEVVCGVEGDSEGDSEGDADCDADCDAEGDADGDDDVVEIHQDGDGQGPNPERGCANGSLDHAREVLMGLLQREHPGENEGIQNALGKMCHGFYASADSSETSDADDSGDDDADTEDSDTEDSDGDDSTHPGNGHAFGRGHGQGKPEQGPANGGGE